MTLIESFGQWCFKFLVKVISLRLTQSAEVRGQVFTTIQMYDGAEKHELWRLLFSFYHS